jgi:hypothetical protein
MILTELSTLIAFAGGSWIMSGPLLWRLLVIVGVVVLVVRGHSGPSGRSASPGR